MLHTYLTLFPGHFLRGLGTKLLGISLASFFTRARDGNWNWSWRRERKNTDFRIRVRCQNVGSTNQISVMANSSHMSRWSRRQSFKQLQFSGCKACYERAGYRELWPKHELRRFFFAESDVFVARAVTENCATVCCRRLQLNTGKLYTALGFDTDKSSAFKLRRLSFLRGRKRLCLSLHAISFSQMMNVLCGSNVLSVTQNQDLHTIYI